MLVLVLGMFCGVWSDKYGWKFLIVLLSFGMIFVVLFYMVVNMIYKGFFDFFFCGFFIYGCFGKIVMINMVVNSYIVDVIMVERCMKKLGILVVM